MPSIEIDEIYNVSSNEKHQRENVGSRLSDFLKVFTFLRLSSLITVIELKHY